MMKPLLKKLLSVLFGLFRFINRKRIIVLAYHDIKNVKRFESHLKLISEYYKPISVFDLSRHLKGDIRLPMYSVLITFDDGDPSVKEFAMPLLQKYQIPAVAFVVSENIKNKQKYWWKVIEDFYQVNHWSHEQARKQIRSLKQLPNYQRLAELNNIAERDPDLIIDDTALDVDALHEMEVGAITIGSHTATHPILNNCLEAELQQEFRRSKEFFDMNGLKNYKFFAYPNGDYDSRLIPLLKYYGVEMAFTFNHRINPKKIDPYEISRIRMNSDDDLVEFKLRVAGISSFFNT